MTQLDSQRQAPEPQVLTLGFARAAARAALESPAPATAGSPPPQRAPKGPPPPTARGRGDRLMPMTSSPPRPPSSLPAPFSAFLSRLRRHPTWIDGGIAAIVLFLDILTVIMVVQSSDHDLQQGFPGLLPGAVTTSLLGAIALTLRRRFPLQAWLTILFVTPLFELAAIAIYDLTPIEARLASGLHSALWMVGLPIMLGTLAVRLRPCRTWMAGLVTLIVVTLSQTLLEEIHGGELTYQITVTGLLYSTGILVGLNTRSHRLRLVDAQLRSERLALEREQAALLAAANERSRIAREMHDVVAHFLDYLFLLYLHF